MKSLGALVSLMLALVFSAGSADAFDGRRKDEARYASGKNYRSAGPRVKGYTARRGGYSYNWAATINTYGDSRTRYGGANFYRDPNIDRQSISGPFDHGFFFDSGMGRIGGSSPYLN